MNRIRVKAKQTGEIGTIPEGNFDPSVFERVDVPEQEQKKGIVESIIRTFTDPVERFGKYTGEAVAQASRVATDPVMRKAVLGQKLTQAENDELAMKQDFFFVDPEKYKDRSSIINEGAKSTAGAASLVTPVGKSAKAIGALGAVSGGLRGFAEDENIVQSAVGGGVGAVALGKGIPSVAKFINGKIPKVGGKIEQLSKQQVLRGLRATPTQQKNFLKSTGTKLEDFATKYNIYEPSVEKVYSVIDPIQQSFDDLAVNTTKTVPAKNLITSFNKRIKELSTPELMRDPASRAKVDFLKNELDILKQSVQGSEQITISGLTKTRQAIDANTRDFALNPDIASKQRLIGDIYRDIVSKEAGTKEIGQELSKLYKFRDIVEQQQGVGKGTKALNLTKLGSAIAGGVAGGVPGAITGLLLEQALSSPSVIGGISKGGQKVGQILQKSQLPNLGLDPKVLQVTGRQLGSNLQESLMSGETSQQDNINQLPNIPQTPQDVMGGQILTEQDIQMAILADLQETGGKNMEKIKQIGEMFGVSSKEQKPVSTATENRIQLASSGLRALTELETILEGDPSKVFKAVVPGKLGARDYDSAAFRAVEGLLRARSGAAIPETEVRRYMKANLPRLGDTDKDIEFKLAAFRRDLEEVANSGATLPNIDELQFSQ